MNAYGEWSNSIIRRKKKSCHGLAYTRLTRALDGYFYQGKKKQRASLLFLVHLIIFIFYFFSHFWDAYSVMWCPHFKKIILLSPLTKRYVFHFLFFFRFQTFFFHVNQTKGIFFFFTFKLFSFMPIKQSLRKILPTKIGWSWTITYRLRFIYHTYTY